MRQVADLVAQEVDALAICFLFSFANPQHEQRAKALISAAYPDLTLAVSHEVDPAFREYERTVVTGFDADVKPGIDRYLSRLDTGLRKSGAQAQIGRAHGGTA